MNSTSDSCGGRASDPVPRGPADEVWLVADGASPPLQPAGAEAAVSARTFLTHRLVWQPVRPSLPRLPRRVRGRRPSPTSPNRCSASGRAGQVRSRYHGTPPACRLRGRRGDRRRRGDAHRAVDRGRALPAGVRADSQIYYASSALLQLRPACMNRPASNSFAVMLLRPPRLQFDWVTLMVPGLANGNGCSTSRTCPRRVRAIELLGHHVNSTTRATSRLVASSRPTRRRSAPAPRSHGGCDWAAAARILAPGSAYRSRLLNLATTLTMPGRPPSEQRLVRYRDAKDAKPPPPASCRRPVDRGSSRSRRRCSGPAAGTTVGALSANATAGSTA